MASDGFQFMSLTEHRTIIQDIFEVFHLRYLLYPYLLHPFESFQELMRQWNLLSSFGIPVFTPDTDIPDLSGKVILITGGGRPSI